MYILHLTSVSLDIQILTWFFHLVSSSYQSNQFALINSFL